MWAEERVSLYYLTALKIKKYATLFLRKSTKVTEAI